jgi:hypothetical protein
VTTPEALPDDIAALKRIIADMARDAVSARADIAKLKFQLACYRRAEFGRSSEKLAREVEQLELAIEALETDQAERLAIASPAAAGVVESAVEARKVLRKKRPLARGAGDPVLEDFGAAGGLQRGMLKVEILGRRSRRARTRKAWALLRLNYATCKPLESLASDFGRKNLRQLPG